MKNLILSLVIAIVSSVNVFGQRIYFSDNTEVLFNQGVGGDTMIHSLFEDNTVYPNNHLSILNHNLTISKVNYNGDVYNEFEQVTDITSEMEVTQYRYSNDTIYLRIKNDNKIRIFVFSDYIPVDESSLSVENQVEVSNLSLYPNPVQDVLNIHFDSYENVDVVVTDLNGRVVYNENVSGLTSVDLSNQPSGIYLVNVGTTTRKVVKQ